LGNNDAMKNSYGNCEKTQSNSISERLKQNKLVLVEEKERKAAITFGILIIAYIVCWSLIIFVTILYVLHATVPPKSVLLLAVMLSNMNSGVNPVIYAVRNQEFQRC